jgi:hypothetical protein
VATLAATDAKLTLQLETSQAYVKKLKEDFCLIEAQHQTCLARLTTIQDDG